MNHSAPSTQGSLFDVIGISLVAALGGFLFGFDTGEDAWRWMLTAGVVPTGLFLVFLFLVPETPRYLAKKGRDAEALRHVADGQGERKLASWDTERRTGYRLAPAPQAGISGALP